jgi:hypothetical protein
MTLGCGGPGGNITSDNITPRHLLNIKRLAYELRPAVPRSDARPAPAAPAGSDLPQAPAAPPPQGIAPAEMARQVSSLIGASGSSRVEAGTANSGAGGIVEFVCEDDVKQALRLGRKIVIGDRTIVTPAARDLAEAHRIFVQAGWPRA